MIRELNRFAKEEPALWEKDFDWQGYEWIDFSDADRSILSYLRKGKGSYLACVHNFTPEVYPGYWIKLGNVKRISEQFNTDAVEYGGSNQKNSDIQVSGEGFQITLAPLATMLFKVEF